MIHVTICTVRGGILLEKALASLCQQTVDFTLSIVDNSAAGDIVGNAQHALPSGIAVEVLHEPRPGLSFARNRAIDNTEAELIAFLDDDAVAEPQWLEKIQASFDQFGSDVCAVGGPVYPEFEVERPEWLSDAVLHIASCLDWGGSPRVTNDHEFLIGCNICYRRSMLLEIGKFATDLGRVGTSALMGNEELDANNKLKEKGYLTVYHPDAAVTHFVPKERLEKSWYRRRMAWQAISDYLMSGFDERESVETISSYVGSVPPSHRGLEVFSYDTEKQEQFRLQLSALKAHLMWALTGYQNLERGPK